MEIIKGKGLTAISTILMAIAWFEIPLKKIELLGFSMSNFEHVSEFEIILPLIVAWVLFLWRYRQGWGDMNRSVRMSFIKSQEGRTFNSDDPRTPTKTVKLDINYVYKMLDDWEYIMYDPSTRSGNRDYAVMKVNMNDKETRKAWRKFKWWSNREYLNYFLPIGFALGGLISVTIIIIRMLPAS